jgi:hypothetical protein
MLNKDELRVLQKVNSIQCTEGMGILPKEVSRFEIPLCRMVLSCTYTSCQDNIVLTGESA